MRPVGDSSLDGGCTDKHKVPFETIHSTHFDRQRALLYPGHL